MARVMGDEYRGEFEEAVEDLGGDDAEEEEEEGQVCFVGGCLRKNEKKVIIFLFADWGLPTLSRQGAKVWILNGRVFAPRRHRTKKKRQPLVTSCQGASNEV